MEDSASSQSREAFGQIHWVGNFPKEGVKQEEKVDGQTELQQWFIAAAYVP